MKILFSCLQLPGTHQMGVALAQELIQRGHRVMFLVIESIETLLKADPANQGIEYGRLNVVQDNLNVVLDATLTPTLPLIECYRNYAAGFEYYLNEMKKQAPDSERHLKEFDPDLIVFDQGFPVPYLMNKNIPWGHLISMNILSIGYPGLPPMFSGLSNHIGKEHVWKDAELALKKTMTDVSGKFSRYMKESGLSDKLEFVVCNESPYFNMYCIPAEIDYFAERSIKLGPKWFRFDALMRIEADHDLKLDSLFPDSTGKLVYFSLGTLASKNVKMMQNLLDMLARIPHRFVVSLGQFADQLKLGRNCVGRNRWPQTKVLQHVQLFISHVGNNSFLEAFATGVPILAMPVFLDQIDNGQRLVDCDLGLTLNPVTATFEQLKSSIESLLTDQSRIDRIRSIAKRIQSEPNIKNACDLLEQTVIQNRQIYRSEV